MFKGVKCIDSFENALRTVMGESEWNRMVGIHGKSHVHMAVSSASLGHPISLGSHSLIIWAFTNLLPKNCVQIPQNTSDESSATTFTITNWEALYAIVNAGRANSSKSVLDPCVSNGCTASVSVTQKGSVISRFSWAKPLRWDKQAKRGVMGHCHVIARVVEMFS